MSSKSLAIQIAFSCRPWELARRDPCDRLAAALSGRKSDGPSKRPLLRPIDFSAPEQRAAPALSESGSLALGLISDQMIWPARTIDRQWIRWRRRRGSRRPDVSARQQVSDCRHDPEASGELSCSLSAAASKTTEAINRRAGSALEVAFVPSQRQPMCLHKSERAAGTNRATRTEAPAGRRRANERRRRRSFSWRRGPSSSRRLGPRQAQKEGGGRRDHQRHQQAPTDQRL